MEQKEPMRDRIKEIILYVVFGVLTTVVNTAAFGVFADGLHVHYLAANVIAWALSVAFAFVTNKYYVFESKSWKKNVWLKECRDFVCARLSTGVLDMLLMYGLVSGLCVEELPAKILVNIFVILANYVLSKLWIFKKQ